METKKETKTGKIVQISGPVIDVTFENESLPKINEQLIVINDKKSYPMEVAQHIGKDTVRCIMLAESEGSDSGAGGQMHSRQTFQRSGRTC